MARRQVISCPWQDEQGNVLALGSVVFEASGDAVVTGTGELCAGIKGSLSLDSGGTVAASPAQYMWPTDQMNPSNITYTVWVYSAAGQLVWGPNYGLTVPSGAGSFNICTWVPNQIGSGSGASAGSLTLQTNGVNNGSQQLLNLVNGSNITITDNGSGSVTIAGSGSNGPRARNWHGWTFAGQAAIEPTQGFGCTPVAVKSGSTTFLELGPTATESNMLGLQSSATGADNPSGWSDSIAGSNDDKVVTLGILGLLERRHKLNSLTNIRVWTGLTYGAQTSNYFAWKSNTPTSPTVAFRYSAGTDTNWTCVVTDGSTQVTHDSGVAADTNGHIFGIEFSGPNTVNFFIDGVSVGSLSIATTTLTTASFWQPSWTIDNQGVDSASHTIYTAYTYWDTTP